MEPWTIARAFAKESWSREYFEKIKRYLLRLKNSSSYSKYLDEDLNYISFFVFQSSAHQAHYEQFGDLHGNVTVNGTNYKLELNVMRDHTHGSIRDWRLMHRYGIQNFTTINGFR